PLLLALHKVCEDTDCRPHADGSGYDWLIPAGNFVPLMRHFEAQWRTDWEAEGRPWVDATAQRGIEVRVRAESEAGQAESEPVAVVPAPLYLDTGPTGSR
ncbi:hypothetical protein, partial [Alkalilimnicola ehrlichii]